MTIPYFHKTQHWESSVGLGEAAVAFSALPWGESPVVARTRAVNFVLEGEERYELDGRVHVVRPGEFLIVDAGTSARAVIPRRGITIGLCVSLPATETETLVEARHAEDSNPLAARTFQFSYGSTPFASVLAHHALRLANGGEMSQEASAALIRHAAGTFIALESSIATEMMRIDARKPSTRRDILQRLHRVRDYMHSRIDGPISLDELARVGGMSQFHLSRTFRAVMDMPPAAYHLEMRMRLARHDLARGHSSVGDVARQYGFSEASSFSRAFRRVNGLPPGSFLGSS